MQVQQIMQRDVSFIDPNMTIRDAARRMRADDVGALLVSENGQLIGMVTDRDIVVRAAWSVEIHGHRSLVLER
jgi:predicted transcriptional regulator